MTEPRPTAVRRGARTTLALIGVAVLVLLVALYLTRRIIAREALVGWLRAHGVAATAQVDALGPGGVAGRVQVGDPKSPDFIAGDAQVTYGLRGLTFEIRSITLRRPVLRARLHDGRLTMGGLDPLIAELRKRPPRPDAAQPRFVADDATVLLDTDYGPLRLVADVVVADGRLMRATAVAAPTRLHAPAFDIALDAATASLTTRGARVDVSLEAAANRLVSGPLSADDARLRLTAQAPYPDLKRQRGDGALTAQATLAGRRVAAKGQSIENATLAAVFTGATTGWIDSLGVTGVLAVDGRATSAGSGAGAGQTRVGVIRIHADAPDLQWRRKGGDVVSATPRVTASVQDVAAGGLRLPQVSGSFAGPTRYGPQGISLALAGSLAGRGAWIGLGAPLAGDGPQLAAVKRAARDFRIVAPGVALRMGPGPAQVSLTEPVRLKPERGGEVTLTDRRGGAYGLRVSGGGLPEIDADIARFSLADGGAVAVGRIRGEASMGPVVDGRLDASGTLRVAGGVTFAADRCVALKARRLQFGERAIEGLDGRFCPAGGPLMAWGAAGWRLHGRGEALRADIPMAQVRLREAAGLVDVSQTGPRLKGAVTVSTAQVTDTATSTRFAPLRLAGDARLAGDLWSADLSAKTLAGQPVATAVLRHDARTGVGGVDIDTGVLRFADGGLQPAQLSPLAAPIGSPAEGSARFAGRLAWSSGGLTSGGVLDVPRLDFTSPAGRVTGLSGKVEFSSLNPLVAAPGQVLRAESVAGVAGLTAATATFEVQPGALLISGGEAAVGGGKVKIESLRVPLTPGSPIQGTLLFEGVQLHDMVEASPFGDRVELDARVSGRMPFESQAGKVRILGGELKAIQPGRLSINRNALTAVEASGAVKGPAAPATPVEANDTFTDFAYQAMENLAFDKLEATVVTRNDERLAVLFHIVGRHDPPTRQQIRLSIFDLIGRKFMNRKLPLPSGTAVDLTLDTSLNLDDLLADYAEYQRLRSSP